MHRCSAHALHLSLVRPLARDVFTQNMRRGMDKHTHTHQHIEIYMRDVFGSVRRQRARLIGSAHLARASARP